MDISSLRIIYVNIIVNAYISYSVYISDPISVYYDEYSLTDHFIVYFLINNTPARSRYYM